MPTPACLRYAPTPAAVLAFPAMERPAILVAEPNHMQRQMIDLLLAADDFDVMLVETSEAALAYLREHTPAAARVPRAPICCCSARWATRTCASGCCG